MELIKYVHKIGKIYEGLNDTRSSITNIKQYRSECLKKIGLSIDAKFGDVPVLHSQDFEGIDAILLQINYSPGKEPPKYIFEKREIPDWGDSYYKKEAKSLDDPVLLQIDICPNKEKYKFDSMRFLGTDGKPINFLGNSEVQIVTDFHYLTEVCSRGDPLTGVYAGKQDIASRGYGKDYVSNPARYDDGIQFHCDVANNWIPRKKMEYLCEALQVFFEEKGYPIHKIDVGQIHREKVSALEKDLSKSNKKYSKLTKKLEKENILKLSEDETEFLNEYFDALHPFLSRLSQLRNKFGDQLDLDPVEEYVCELPTDGPGRLKDLSNYTNGLKRAVENSNNNLTMIKLKRIFGELSELNSKLSPNYQPPENTNDLIDLLFS